MQPSTPRPVASAAIHAFHTLRDVVARLDPVRVARTEAERRAIFRMRYAVYVEELRYPMRHVDAAAREVRTPEDDADDATLFYTGSPEAVSASLRVRAWAPGAMPRDIHRQFSLDRFPDIDTRAVCEVGMLMARRDLRGSARVLAATAGAVESTVLRHGTELMVASCIPSTLRAYLGLGLRPFGGRMFSAGGAMDIPLVGITADLEHARRCGSPWYPTLRRLAARGKLPTRDFAALLPPLADGGVEVDPARVAAEVAARVPALGESFLRDLPDATRDVIARSGFVLAIPAGLVVQEEGIANRDLFVVLAGELSLTVGDGRDLTLTAGDVFGALGFLLGRGRPRARVTTLSPGRVLHLRHGALRRLGPRDAAALHEALGRSLARGLTAGEGA
jgi:hypothetical protein